MPTFTDTDLRTIADPPTGALADELEGITKQVQQAIWNANAAIQRLDTLLAGPAPRYLPASALTEDAIVAALKADPGMAGRVIVALALSITGHERQDLQRAAYNRVTTNSNGFGSTSLQSLAVALAAASYRG